MVLTRSQYENMSKEELRNINSSFVNDINTKMSNLTENLMNSRQNMIRFIQNFSNVKSLTTIYWQRSCNWSLML